MRSSVRYLFAAAAALRAYGLPQLDAQLGARQASSKLVFCHFMIGVVSDRTSAAAYDSDMQRAKAMGIDAFALNIGTDSYTDQQLGFAYQSAANNGMKVFISFDFNWWNTGQGSAIGSKIAQYAGLSAQLFVSGKVFVSSFAGDGVNVAAIRSAAGRAIYFAPNYHPGQGDFSTVDGALNWMGWPSNGKNKAPSGGVTVTVDAGDQFYRSALSSKGYIARTSSVSFKNLYSFWSTAASPWFSTHFGAEVSYSKNWVFPSDLLWYLRWREILALQPTFVEIVTWNDYGESHYIGPLSSQHTDDGSSKWANDMPHNGWLDMAKPFIQAYKAGSTSPNQYITSDQIIYWYRIAPKALNCDATDTTMQAANNASGNFFEGRPDGYNTMQDNIHVVTLLKAAGTVLINSGSTAYTYNAPAGASALAVPFHVGSQSFALTRSGAQVMSATSLKLIQNVCPCGLYNFNAYVGTVPAVTRDVLSGGGLSGFPNGLKVACAATPSLPATPPATTRATTTIVATAAPTSPLV
ncbi:glycoside hydrolase family 71 protein [Mycena metata]|uniref:Glycoside hydrolase family 71 protein n=1 Tax=Mycena metata TaxID=1033252 RepID=A0AAD7JLU6_9AGAR|nr:glycoside hydrolase family 71 protein [Mycena metata]